MNKDRIKENLDAESVLLQEARGKIRASPKQTNKTVQREAGPMEEPTGPFLLKQKKERSKESIQRSNKFKTDGAAVKKTQDKRFSADKDNKEIKPQAVKNDSKLTQKEQRQKQYILSKLEKPKQGSSYKRSDDEISQHFYNSRNKNGRGKYKSKAVKGTFKAAKYTANSFDQYSQSKEQTQEISAKAINNTSYKTVKAVNKAAGLPTRFVPKVLGNKRSNEGTNVIDFLLQEKRNSKRYALKRQDDISFGITDTHRKIISKLKRRSNNNTIKLIIGGICLIFLISSLSATGVVFKGASDALGIYLTGLSPSTDFDMTDTENYFAKKELELQDMLDDPSSFFPGFDYYEVICEEPIGHDAVKLMAYLSSVYEDYELSGVSDILDELFLQMYEIETYVTKEVVDEEETETFHIKVTKKDWDSLMATRITDKDLYDSYIDYGGGHQAFASPFTGNWSSNVTSPFGWRIHPILKEERFHNGIDIAKPMGTPVASVSKGVVVTSAYSDTAGNFVVVEDSAGYRVSYMHLSKISVKAGDEVDYDSQIGLVGSTGLSTGPHLHLSITDKSGNYLNPLFLVQGGS